ncbi:MAG: hypothetical protein ACM3ZE_07290 [Myxococcales bacterium]
MASRTNLPRQSHKTLLLLLGAGVLIAGAASMWRFSGRGGTNQSLHSNILPPADLPRVTDSWSTDPLSKVSPAPDNLIRSLPDPPPQETSEKGAADGPAPVEAPDAGHSSRRAEMCLDDPRPGFAQSRARYLASFVSRRVWNTTLYVHPSAPEWAIREIQESLARINYVATLRLHLAFEPPVVYLYPDVEALQEHSCIRSVAIAYYDGAIHLAASTLGQEKAADSPSGHEIWKASNELRRSLQHEYVHHLLRSNGIAKPFWFQEGAAMIIAQDVPATYRSGWMRRPIPTRQMVEAVPDSVSAEFANTYYAQAFAMADFLERRCRQRCGLDTWADALKHGVNPESLFDWAISRSGDNSKSEFGSSPWTSHLALLASELSTHETSGRQGFVEDP